MMYIELFTLPLVHACRVIMEKGFRVSARAFSCDVNRRCMHVAYFQSSLYMQLGVYLPVHQNGHHACMEITRNIQKQQRSKTSI